MFQNGLLATRKIDGQSLHCNEQKEAGDENHVIGYFKISVGGITDIPSTAIAAQKSGVSFTKNHALLTSSRRVMIAVFTPATNCK